MTRRWVSMTVSATAPRTEMPPLLIRMSTPPWRAMAAFALASMSEGLERSKVRTEGVLEEEEGFSPLA